MTLFPIQPINGTLHSIEGRTWEYNDGVWDLLPETLSSELPVVSTVTEASNTAPTNTAFSFDLTQLEPVEEI